jgi:hypothetical protein
VATALGCALEQASKAPPLRVRERGVAPPDWQKGFFDHVLRSQESAGEKWKYVRENPVRAGLVGIPASGDISARFLRWTIAWNVCDVRAGIFVAALYERRILSAVADRRYRASHTFGKRAYF